MNILAVDESVDKSWELLPDPGLKRQASVSPSARWDPYNPAELLR